MIIKVCGMKEPGNIAAVAALPIDLMGLIFYPPSPRYVDTDLVEAQLPSKEQVAGRVGVFVNTPIAEVVQAVVEFQLDYVQLHGDETPAYCQQATLFAKVIKAFRVDEGFDFSRTVAYEGLAYLLFDARGKNYGGNGHKFNWAKLNEYTGTTPFLLSGGIGQEDVETIKSVAHPQFAGIDLNSGFESAPGIKQPELLHTFISELK